MRKLLIAGVVAAVCCGFVAQSASALYAEYYRDNLFLGLAYHRVACLTNWTTIQDNQDYDGFSNTRYCYTGATANSVPGGQWFDATHTSGKSQLDACGSQANNRYGTPNYARRSNTCNYNILFDCNSDCWIREFSTCQNDPVSIASPCW
ncbi:MAG: hypothetical protein AAGC55_18015 [Myxococcota bacterium]